MTNRKPEIKTDHKGFNKLANYKGADGRLHCAISAGNVIADWQKSLYIRAHSEIECNGFIYRPGHLRAFDMQSWNDIPRQVRQWLDEDKTEVILYEFRTYNKKKKIVHGYVITRPNKATFEGEGENTTMINHDEILQVFYLNNSYKSMTIVDEAMRFIAKERK